MDCITLVAGGGLVCSGGRKLVGRDDHPDQGRARVVEVAVRLHGIGDLWVLRYHGGEIDDGQGFTSNATLSRAHFEKFMTPPESVVDTDVVIWYTANTSTTQESKSATG